MQIFAERSLSEVLKAHGEAMRAEIQNELPNKLLNVNESDFVTYLMDKYQIEPLSFAFESLQITQREKMVSIEQHPWDSAVHFMHNRKNAYPRQVITFHLPYSGDGALLNCQPRQHIIWSSEVTFSPNEITFDLVNWRDDAAELKREQNEIVERIKTQNAYVTEEAKEFNSTLEQQARSTLTERKNQLLKQFNIAESLGIPLRKASNVPHTFALPISPKKFAIKPASSEVQHSSDPTVDEETYDSILSIVHDTGVAMERQPSIYANKLEENLRDFMLMTLGTHYPNTTGETFNKNGKTDILIRHQGKNAFVGECKFWGGLKAFHATIDQILSYLTWRDSKAAIICFVKNKELNPVLEQITAGAPEHPCFIRLESRKGDSWSQFEFRLRSDPARNIHLAVLCFHFPPP